MNPMIYAHKRRSRPACSLASTTNAYIRDKSIESIIQQWPGIVSEDELLQELAEIRKQGYAQVQRPFGITMSARFPDPIHRGGWVAIGAFGKKQLWSAETEMRIITAGQTLSRLCKKHLQLQSAKAKAKSNPS